MGLTLRSKHSVDFDMGYITFYLFRSAIAYFVPEHCRAGTVRFLEQSDAEGKLTPKECKDLLKDIKDMEDKGIYYGYVGRGVEGCLTITKFKELLQNCISHRCNLKWY